MSVRRTGVAALLTGIVVLVPCAAWYIGGSRAVDARAAAVEEAPRRRALDEAVRLAEQLSLRLEAMRESESRRPFADYMGDDELAGLVQCGEVVRGPSPLAEGPADPLIWAHFQIDDVGQLTLPTLSAEDSSPGARHDSRDVDDIQVAILEELECASSQHFAALRRLPDESRRERRQVTDGGVVLVGPFEWHGASLRGSAALVALREVTTPTAVLTQGFVVQGERLERLVAGAPFPARVVSGVPAKGAAQARIPLGGDPLMISLDPSEAIGRAREEARELRAAFRIRFSIGALGALLAGTAIVALVRQTERLAAQRARFAAAAAHELRTPLAGLQLYGEMLADGSGAAERTGEYARRIAVEAERLGRVVTNVLGFSRLEQGRLDVHPTEGDLAPAVRESVERMRPALESGGAAMDLRIEEDLPPARFDRDALHGMLQNLIDNAEKYSRNATDRTITVELCGNEAGHLLTIADRGPGISRARGGGWLRPKLRREAGAATAGLGIGLPLVRALARAQGAVLSHRPGNGAGTVFSILFPRSA